MQERHLRMHGPDTAAHLTGQHRVSPCRPTDPVPGRGGPETLSSVRAWTEPPSKLRERSRHGFGPAIAWVKDPAGNILSVLQEG
jgi:hypothetical protein